MGPAASEASPALLAVLEDPEASVRAASADALAQIPLTESLRAALTKALDDKDVLVQLSAVHALARDEQAIPACLPVLRKAFKNEELSIRVRAANISADFTGPHARSAVPLLVEALEDEQRQVQGAVARALKKIDPKAAAKAGIR
jgi:HEAT repeat protein